MNGNFAKNYNVLSYNCVLYSIVISIAYFFKPIHIAFVMRFIGVILMCSSIFPTYLLSKEILKSKSKAIIISAFSLLLPEFALSLYMIQEVLCYPLFLWIAYLTYLHFTREKNIVREIILYFLLAIIFFVKSYAIVYAVAYFGTLCLINLKNKDYKKLGKSVLKGFSCLAIIIFGIILIRLFNGEGVNHYSNQISQIFPLDTEKIVRIFLWNILLYSTFPILYRIFASTYSYV
ncbi:MAG: hypothetical protein HFJ50_02110 [Clostridia bacterium]|jgi:hypothetical protein|nr:hypothetical protein [Clostridia bacterium]